MVTKTKEYQVLDIEDVEKAVSEAAGRKVTIGEMDVTLIDGAPMDALFEHDTDEFYMTSASPMRPRSSERSLRIPRLSGQKNWRKSHKGQTDRRVLMQDRFRRFCTAASVVETVSE